ncbi:acanthoscurrin-2 [Selaginella moellendorffii]|uniref:acanthoscurrin-2 n=1 Tax=Selaginella moellendorffii TaxID=88036 RepID=UPI000D1D029D|nr:acanthoscurrin-2 [Selaginella moellendorffii]|eukprot:XP_024524802.1 acanthoscurrin-2 [Selaginella moellendorffii]
MGKIPKNWFQRLLVPVPWIKLAIAYSPAVKRIVWKRLNRSENCAIRGQGYGGKPCIAHGFRGAGPGADAGDSGANVGGVGAAGDNRGGANGGGVGDSGGVGGGGGCVLGGGGVLGCGGRGVLGRGGGGLLGGGGGGVLGGGGGEQAFGVK